MNIFEIHQRMDRATPGPWTLRRADWQCDCGGNEKGFDHESPEGCSDGWWITAAWVDGPAALEFGDGWTGFNDADGDFMAHAREDIPALCDALGSALARAGRAEVLLAEIPWESIISYFTHGDYGPDAWLEIDEWIRDNAPPKVQP